MDDVTTRQVQVTIDAAAPGALMAFWCEVLGYEPDGPPPGFATWDDALNALGVPPEERDSRSACHDPHGAGPRLFFQRVTEAGTTGSRLHLDVRAAPGLGGTERMAALEAEAERLVALGASRLRRHEPAPPLEAGHVVMADPEGNVFCLD